MIRSLFFRACLVISLVLPAACSIIGGGAPGALEAASPLEADPRALVVQLTKPVGLPVGDGDLALGLQWAVPGQERLRQEAGLKVARRSTAAPDRSGRGARDRVDLVLSPEDAARIAALMARIREDKQAGISGKGAFSVSFTAHCVVGSIDFSEMVVDVALTLKPGRPPIELMREARIGSLLQSRGIERLPACQEMADRDR